MFKDLKMEEDAQWVFFTELAFAPAGRLRIVNEEGRTFFVDVKARQVAAG
jgi:hypothetical protein